MNPLKLLDGYKTYIGAAGFALLGVYHLIQGEGAKATEYFAYALSILGIRHAITKSTGV